MKSRGHLLAALLCACLQACAPAARAQSVFEASIADLGRMLASGEVTSAQLVEQYLARIEAYDRAGPRLNSIVRVNPAARELAAALDRERATTGPRGPLHGIPILVKDNYNTADMPTSGGSVALADFVPDAAATQVKRLVVAGAVVLAKTNLHEYAYGITSVGSLIGQTRNPYDYRRVPGGSSGGTGAAVAASLGAVGMGSDTCGSIRIPAAFNNLAGLRPSKGLSSIHGVMPLSHTQDTAGPLARDIEDLAIVLDVVAGYDADDSATEVARDRPPARFRARLGEVGLAGLRFGRLDSYLERADGATRGVIEEALEWLEAQGATVVPVEIPELAELISRSGVIGHEFRFDLDQYLARFGSERIRGLADIVDLGLHHQAVAGQLHRSRDAERDEAAYRQALAARGELRMALEQVFAERELDAIVYPAIGRLPVLIGESQPGNNCSIAANSGLPALSLPAGFSDSGLPVGMELLAGFLQDERLLAMGYAIEAGYPRRRAPAATPDLVDGAAPPARAGRFRVEGAGFDLQGEIRVDPALNRFEYELRLSGAGAGEISAVVLASDDGPAPAILNLMGPDEAVAAGGEFMTPRLRRAVANQPLRLRIFGSRLPPEGIAAALALDD